MTLYRSRIFPVLAGVLWMGFLFLAITDRGDSTWVKFAAICLCCITALPGAKGPCPVLHGGGGPVSAGAE